jgi:hypothetical protein
MQNKTKHGPKITQCALCTTPTTGWSAHALRCTRNTHTHTTHPTPAHSCVCVDGWMCVRACVRARARTLTHTDILIYITNRDTRICVGSLSLSLSTIYSRERERESERKTNTHTRAPARPIARFNYHDAHTHSARTRTLAVRHDGSNFMHARTAK